MPKRYRLSRSVVDMVSVGVPPASLTAASGKAFEVAAVQMKYRDLKQHGVTKIHATLEADNSGRLPSPEVMTSVEKMVASMEKQVEQRITERLLAEQRKCTESRAWAYHLETYHHVVVRRIFQEWLKTKAGKEAKERATKALKIAYGGDMASINGDFVVESKTILRRLRKAQEDGDSKSGRCASDKLAVIQKVAENNLMPTFSGQGFLDILGAYSDANEPVHKCFTKKELQEICDEATTITTSEGSAWLVQFAQDLLTSSNRILD